MKCWNCLFENAKKEHHCVKCDQALQPNAAQQIASSRHLDYLLRELGNWDFLPSEARSKLESVYRNRQSRLAQITAQKTEDWPQTDWPSESIEPLPTKAEPLPPSEEDSGETRAEESEELQEPIDNPLTLIQKEESTSPAPTAQSASRKLSGALLAPNPDSNPPEEPGYLDSLVGEADIRWFHTLGALLVVAAVVGWLRASWDSYGKLMTGLLIASSPLLLHFVSAKLKKSVPLSSRLLAILANVLTPPALLALDIFGMLPEGVSSAHYWTFSLLLSSGILCFQAQSTKEKIPLYLGALCCVMAGWSQGGLTTASLSLAIGFVFARDWGETNDDWLRQRQTVSFYAGSFGALATLTLFEPSRHPTVPIVAFSAALLFTSLPTLTGQDGQGTKSRLYLQAVLSLVGSLLMRTALDLPAGGVALYLLLCSALFLTVNPDSHLARLSTGLAGALGFLGLGIGFFSSLPDVLRGEQSAQDAFLRLLFSALGAAYFLGASRKQAVESEAQPLILASALSLLGGWIHFGLFLHPPDRIAELLPLLASLLVFEGLLLGASRKLSERERKVVWSLSLPLIVFTAVLTFLGQILTPETAFGWSLLLAAHGLVSFLWERRWLAGWPSVEKSEYRAIAVILPRLVLATAALSFCQNAYVPHPQIKLLAGLTLATAGTFLLRDRYRNACWESAWLLNFVGLAVLQNELWLLGAASTSCLLATSVGQRKAISLALSCGLGTLVLIEVGSQAALPLLFLPVAAFAVATILPARDDKEWRDVGFANWGFPILLGAVIFFGKSFPSGSLPNLLYCLLLGLLSTSCVAILQRQRPPLLLRLLNPYTGPALLIALLLWSLGQTTGETALLLLLSGCAVAFLSNHQHKWEVSNGLLLIGAAQSLTNTHFVLDTVALCGGVVLFELYGLVSSRPSPHRAHLAVLFLALASQHSQFWPQLIDPALILSTLILAVRAVHTDHILVAGLSSCLFLFRVDESLQSEHLDLRIRLLPTALVLIASSLWKFRSEQTWPRPALRLGLALLVAPALLNFAAGFNKWENFLWTLLFGAAFVGIHFLLKGELRSILRQAGGYTLASWAVVSLTRAALSLPWQAGTLVVGLLLVGAGVSVEKKRRNRGE